MGWTWYSGKACLLSGNPGDMILQVVSQSAGIQYVIKFTISGMTQGKLKLNNYEEEIEFEENRTYAVVGTAVNGTLVFTGELDGSGDLFNGCIDGVEVYTLASQTEISCSPCLNVREEQDECLLVMTAESTGNALNFNWEGLTLKARIGARFAKVEYDETSEELDDNNGEHLTVYFDGKKNRNLQIDAAPIFVHDFLFMCKGVDSFKINGAEYVILDRYPSINWNRKETEGTAELRVRKKNYRLNKTNCG